MNVPNTTEKHYPFEKWLRWQILLYVYINI